MGAALGSGTLRAGALASAALTLACSVAALTLACSPAPTGPNVLLVSIDTLRADHTSAYGYGRPTTPRLAALAEEGVRIEVAYSPTATTGPSHATLFTGHHPIGHGVVKNGELYDLERDPGEVENRYYDEPERARALLAELEAWRTRFRRAGARGAALGLRPAGGPAGWRRSAGAALTTRRALSPASWGRPGQHRGAASPRWE